MSDFRPIMLNLPTYLNSDVINGRSLSNKLEQLEFKMEKIIGI